MLTHTCERRTLAHCAHCRVETCGCDIVHITVGPVTFRTTAEMAESLRVTLATGLDRLRLDESKDSAREFALTGPKANA